MCLISLRLVASQLLLILFKSIVLMAIFARVLSDHFRNHRDPQPWDRLAARIGLVASARHRSKKAMQRTT
jgi:hypothetical protein